VISFEGRQAPLMPPDVATAPEWGMELLPGGVLSDVARESVSVALRNRGWMTWNLLLAGVPVVIALGLFRYRGARSAVWWVGAALFVLFLPNAPYVVTDLVHLRHDIVAAGSNRAEIAAVLPLYAVFIGAGYLAYYVSLGELARYLDRSGLGRWRSVATMMAHLACAVGVVLGRVARLNSWEPVTQPQGALERIVLTLSWRQAPVALVLTFAAIWLCYTITRSVVEGTVLPWWQTLQSVAGRAPGG
jgi:uncharacterized membrane protein